MNIDPVTAGVVTWMLVASACYFFLRRTAYNVFDPLVVINISIPFSAALLAVLCTTELVSADKLVLFCVTLLAYLAGGRIAAAFFGRETFRQTAIDALNDVRRGEIYVILSITLCLTVLVGALALAQGAAGDERQAFGRAFRPLILVQTGLFWFALVLLLSRKLSTVTATTWLTAFMVLSIPFSGKGVLAPLIYWFGLKVYLNRQPISFRAVLTVLLIVLVGAGAMTLLAYGTSSALEAFQLVTRRFWFSGDVYILAYQREGLAGVRGNYPVTFLAYMMHPVTSLVGMRAYDKPLGGMLASTVMREDVLTGPNPQLPVVLDFFFPDGLATSAAIAFLIGLAVFSIRPLGTFIAMKARSRYLRLGGIIAALFSPAAGFIDTSQVSIALVGFVAATVLLVALEMLFAARSAPGQPVGQVA